MTEVLLKLEDVFLMGQVLKHLVVRLQCPPEHRPFPVVLFVCLLAVLLLCLLGAAVVVAMLLLHWLACSVAACLN
jgi:hypothetical protein